MARNQQWVQPVDVVPDGLKRAGVVLGLLCPIVGAIIALTQWGKQGSMAIRAATVVGFFFWWILLTSP
ncbi:MAG TPA: hypothetical protein VFJ19_18445 [Nocardioidaceae bacterium]|nr:hypothetical protein [Nocardioidaceae bacterium]